MPTLANFSTDSIRLALRKKIEQGAKLSEIANEVGIPQNSLYSFLYKNILGARKTKNLIKLHEYVNNISSNEFRQFQKAESLYITSHFFVYRKSIESNRLIKTKMSVLEDKITRDGTFVEYVKGKDRFVIIKGTVKKIGGNMYLDGSIYMDKNISINLDNLLSIDISSSSIIGKQLYVYTAEYEMDLLIRSVFTTLSGHFRPICGVCVITNTDNIQSFNSIGNIDESDFYDQYSDKTRILPNNELRDQLFKDIRLGTMIT